MKVAEDMTTRLTEQLQTRIYGHLESAFPNEGGGFLLGRVEADTITILDTIPIENVFETEEQFHRYAIDLKDWARWEDEADERQLSIVGYYHSHPNSPAVPSIFDRDHAPFTSNFVYLITSVLEGAAADLRGWRLRTDRSQFDADEVITEQAT